VKIPNLVTLSVLVHSSYMPGPHPQRGSRSHEEAVEWLVHHGLVVQRSDEGLDLTNLGYHHVRACLFVPAASRVAHELDKAMDQLLEPTDPVDRPKYRALVSTMQRARDELLQLSPEPRSTKSDDRTRNRSQVHIKPETSFGTVPRHPDGGYAAVLKDMITGVERTAEQAWSHTGAKLRELVQQDEFVSSTPLVDKSHAVLTALGQFRRVRIGDTYHYVDDAGQTVAKVAVHVADSISHRTSAFAASAEAQDQRAREAHARYERSKGRHDEASLVQQLAAALKGTHFAEAHAGLIERAERFVASTGLSARRASTDEDTPKPPKFRYVARGLLSTMVGTNFVGKAVSLAEKHYVFDVVTGIEVKAPGESGEARSIEEA
jgi:hypothetical protein